jgi:hypothetical protein
MMVSEIFQITALWITIQIIFKSVCDRTKLVSYTCECVFMQTHI